MPQPLGPIAGVRTVNYSSTSDQLANANERRKMLSVFNNATAALYLAYGDAVSTTKFTVRIPQHGHYELPTAGDHVYRGVISGVWDVGGTGFAQVTEEG